MARSLCGKDDDDPGGAAPRDQVTGQCREFCLLFPVADGGGEVGVFVDDDQVDGFARLAGYLAAAFGQQRVVTAVHDDLEPLESLDRGADTGSDEDFGAAAPLAELDLLAVDQDELAVGGQGAVRDDEVERVGFPAAGFAAEQHVAFGQVHVDVFAVFVNAQVDRVEHGQREHRCCGHLGYLLSESYKEGQGPGEHGSLRDPFPRVWFGFVLLVVSGCLVVLLFRMARVPFLGARLVTGNLFARRAE